MKRETVTYVLKLYTHIGSGTGNWAAPATAAMRQHHGPTVRILDCFNGQLVEMFLQVPNIVVVSTIQRLNFERAGTSKLKI